MYKSLIPHAIGVRPDDLQSAIAAAQQHGFAGLEVNIREIAAQVDEHDAQYVRELFDSAGVRPAGWGLPVNWRGDETEWRKSLDELPRLAEIAATIGALRTSTWVPPVSDERDFDENYQFHVDRFRPVAQTLATQGCSLGLEFIGPKTSRDNHKYPFIYTMRNMLELAADIGPNVGLLLDCWHWYTSHGTVQELQALRPEQVVYVHVNDAPEGIDVDDQLDSVRALPGETGVIDIVGFLRTLQAIGYDGPVGAEPFKKELSSLPSDDDRLRTISSAMDGIFRQAGLNA